MAIALGAGALSISPLALRTRGRGPGSPCALVRGCREHRRGALRQSFWKTWKIRSRSFSRQRRDEPFPSEQPVHIYRPRTCVTAKRGVRETRARSRAGTAKPLPTPLQNPAGPRCGATVISHPSSVFGEGRSAVARSAGGASPDLMPLTFFQIL